MSPIIVLNRVSGRILRFLSVIKSHQTRQTPCTHQRHPRVDKLHTASHRRHLLSPRFGAVLYPNPRRTCPREGRSLSLHFGVHPARLTRRQSDARKSSATHTRQVPVAGSVDHLYHLPIAVNEPESLVASWRLSFGVVCDRRFSNLCFFTLL
jgi:hypothetical protein